MMGNANEDEVNGWMFNERLLNEKDLLTRALTKQAAAPCLTPRMKGIVLYFGKESAQRV